MISEIKKQWRQDVEEAYRRAREKLNEKYAGETVIAKRGRWGLLGSVRTEREDILVEKVEIYDRGERGAHFVPALVTSDGDEYIDFEEIEVR